VATHRVPPHDLDAEQAIIGSILLDNQVVNVVLDKIGPSDFYKNSHRLIVEAIIELFLEQKGVDIVTLSSILKDKGMLDQAGGASYLSTLQENTPSSANVEHYITIVKEKSDRRDLIKQSEETLARCFDQADDISDIVSGAPRRTIQKDVEDRIGELSKKTSQDLSLNQIYQDLGYKTKEERSNCRRALSRLVEKGKLIPVGNRSGLYKNVNHDSEILDFLNADTTPYEFKCPLGSHEFVKIFSKSIAVIAGTTNSGKSAFCLNLAKLNRHIHPVSYFSSEMEATELRVRLDKFSLPLHQWSSISFRYRVENFHEVIEPDGFNIIDYLTIHKDFYEVAGLIWQIHAKLNKGIAFIAIQKPPGRDAGIGGQRTLDLARLYLSIEPGVFKIVKGKIWANEAANPNGLIQRFTLGGGANFKLSNEKGEKNEWYKGG
jgi:DnaB-like helicase N terminal domain/DnaB-like helicase C terminal domain